MTGRPNHVGQEGLVEKTWPGRPRINGMRSINAVLVALALVLIAALLGAVLYLGFKLDSFVSAFVALAALTVMVLYTSISGRFDDRRELDGLIADLSRGTGDIARQVAEISRRLNAMEAQFDSGLDHARDAFDPLAAEIDELGEQVREIADAVAAHSAVLQSVATAPPAAAETRLDAPAAAANGSSAANGHGGKAPAREGLAALVAKAIEADRVEFFLQPIVTLPQRKVRYYEALTRLRTEDGDIIPAGDFIDDAESAGLMPKIDTLLVFRCAQVIRRLQLKSRDVGLFCNMSAATLTDPTYFKQIRDFLDASRALAPALMFEFKQSAFRAFGPREQESLAALAGFGFHFSMDHVADLRMEPKDLADASFRFMKVPAKLLLDPASGAHSDIHPADLADQLARAGIDLVADHIESESMVVELLDCDVRFGQGFLFSPARPVKMDAYSADATDKAAGEADRRNSGIRHFRLIVSIAVAAGRGAAMVFFMNAALPPLLPHFSPLAENYDVLLSDVWGVVHNGLTAWPRACDALMRARARGATVVLITNAPRPGEQVIRQLDKLHVPREAYDAIVSSGDVTRGVIETRHGQSLNHLGPERDLSIFKGLDLRFAPPETADYVVCTGLEDDEVETPDDYRARLEVMLKRKLLMVCGNPDVVVERGPRLVYCAGAIADLYATMGGEVIYAGKPYRPIYEMALQKAQSAAGRKVALDRVLAIGDFGTHGSQRCARRRRRFSVRDFRHPRRGTGWPRATE